MANSLGRSAWRAGTAKRKARRKVEAIPARAESPSPPIIASPEAEINWRFSPGWAIDILGNLVSWELRLIYNNLVSACVRSRQRRATFILTLEEGYFRPHSFSCSVFRQPRLSGQREGGQPMSIRCVCQNGHVLKVKDSFAGTSGFCPSCRARVDVPKLQKRSISEDAILGLLGKQSAAERAAAESSGVLLAASEFGYTPPAFSEKDLQPLQSGGLHRRPHLPPLPHLHRQPQRLLVYLSLGWDCDRRRSLLGGYPSRLCIRAAGFRR